MPRPSPQRLELLRRRLAEKGVRANGSGPIPRRTGDADVPLSSAQQRLWFLDQFESERSLYNDCLILHIHGTEIREDLFQQAFGQVVERHESLRTSFHLDGTQPVQRVHDSVRLPMRSVDLRHNADPEERLRELALEDIHAPFDLDDVPLFHGLLCRMDDDVWSFVLTMHHIISDGVSYGIIYQEIGELYQAALRKRTANLPDLSIQLADYALWERASLEEEEIEEKVGYWTKELAGDLPALSWPARGQAKRRGGSVHFELDRSEYLALTEFCTQEKVTTNWVLLASYYAFLHVLGGDTDVRVGLPSSMRKRPELENLIGFFIQTLVLRMDLDGDPTFGELLDRTRDKALEASSYEDAPFDRIVQALRREGLPESTPLIQAWFAHMKDLFDPLPIKGSKTSYEFVDGGHARFDLSLILDEADGKLRGFFEYDEGVFERGQVERFPVLFQSVLRTVVGNSRTKLSALRNELRAQPRPVETAMPATPEATKPATTPLPARRAGSVPGPKKKLETTTRRPVQSAQQDWVDVRPLVEGKSIPMVVEPKMRGLNLVTWTQSNREYVDALYEEHHALLFRGFEAPGIEDFQRFVDAASSGDRLAYKDRSTPRSAYGDKIYNATVYPPDQTIRLHNEGTYWMTWARKIFFSCITAADRGGETPIADVNRVYRNIDPGIRREFEAKGVLYVRNFNGGLGLTWQEVFQTENRAEVESYCRDNDIEFEWLGGERLRTRQQRPAVRRHPVTGDPLWFNHAAFFHVSALAPELRRTFLDELGEADLPYSACFGDGSPIPPEVVSHLLFCYDREKVVFPWQEGDCALYDNMWIAHARQPFEGERLTLVAMSEAYRGTDDLRQTG